MGGDRAASTCRCCELLERTAAPLTLGADARALRPARDAAADRPASDCVAFLRDTRAVGPRRGRDRAGAGRRAASWRPRCAAPSGDYSARRRRVRGVRRRPARTAAPGRGRGTARAVDLGGHPRGAAAAGDRRRAATCRSRPASPATGGASAAGAAASGCPSAPTRPGSSSGLAAARRARLLRRPDGRARARLGRPARADRDRRRAGRGADRLADRRAGLARRQRLSRRLPLPRLPPRDRPPHAPVEQRAARPYSPRRRARGRPRARARLRRAGDRAARRLRAPSGAGPGVLCCAFDTELLGHWWYEGIEWLRGVVDEAAAQGLELATVGDAVGRVEPVAPRAGGVDLGDRQGPHDLGLAARRRASRSRRAAPSCGRSRQRRRQPRRARRSSAPRASCWRSRRATGPFLVTRDLAADYPRRARRATTRAALDAALGALADSTAVPEPSLRNLAPDLALSSLAAP